MEDIDDIEDWSRVVAFLSLLVGGIGTALIIGAALLASG
jgi:hypothetical protein